MRNLRRIVMKEKGRYKFKQRDTFLHNSLILVILLPRLIHFMIFPQTGGDFDLIKLKIEIEQEEEEKAGLRRKYRKQLDESQK